MPIPDQELLDAIQHGQTTAADAKATRERVRWREAPGNAQREAALDRELVAIAAAMGPIRSLIGRLPYETCAAPLAEEVRAVSQQLQYERRQLKKMRKR